MDRRLPELADALCAAAAWTASRGWAPATSGNFSVRVDEHHALVTASGVDKGRLSHADLLLTELSGRVVRPVAEGSPRRPSAESLLHLQLYRRMHGVGAVLHAHTPTSTVLTLERPGDVQLQGYELQKAYAGQTTHEAMVRLPVVPNTQDMDALVASVDAALDAGPTAPAYLIRGHGVYAWGTTLDDARRHLEATEFLLECERRRAA